MKSIERYTRIATYIFIECAQNSESGNWNVNFEEVENFFGFKFTEEIYDKVIEKLYEDFPKAILEIDGSYEERNFDITLGTDFTLNNTESNADYGMDFDSEEEFEFENSHYN